MASGIYSPIIEFTQTTLTGLLHTTGFFSTGSHQPKPQWLNFVSCFCYALLTKSIDFHSSAFCLWHQHSAKARLSPFTTTQTMDRKHSGWNPTSDPEGTSGQTHSSSGASLQGEWWEIPQRQERNHEMKHWSSFKWSEVLSEGTEIVSGCILVRSLMDKYLVSLSLSIKRWTRQRMSLFSWR